MAKTPKNEMKLSFPSLSENERLARIAISGFVSLVDPRLDELTDIKTAVSEAVTNAIVHAYRGSFGTVELTARIYDGGLVYIKIKDKGCGIPDIAKAMEPLYSGAPNEERAGLGFTVMQSFTDRLTVRSQVGKGTAVTMRKKMCHAADEAAD